MAGTNCFHIWFGLVLVLVLIDVSLCQPGKPVAIVEKGEFTNIQCTTNLRVANLTWQVWDASRHIYQNLQLCNFTSLNCTGPPDSIYQADAAIVAGSYHSSLNISAARVYQTEFRCNYDKEGDLNKTLEVYAWPGPVSCSYQVSLADLQLTCQIENVYPAADGHLYLDTGNLTSANESYTVTKNCSRSEYGKGSGGDYSATCTWSIPLANLSVTRLDFVAEIVAVLSDASMVDRGPVRSNTVTVEISAPYPIIHDNMCPVGPGVIGDKIKVNTSATCLCNVEPGKLDFLPRQARWFSADGKVVGFENSTDHSSTLTIAYTGTGNQTYHCGAVSALKDYFNQTFNPTFISAGKSSIVEKGAPVIIECIPESGVTVITIYILENINNPVLLTTCSLTSKNCTTPTLPLYRVNLEALGNSVLYKSILRTVAVSVKESDFRCAYNNGKSSDYNLEVYAWPKNVFCSTVRSSEYTQFQCTIPNVYPKAEANIRFIQGNLSTNDIDSQFTSCKRGAYGLGSDHDYAAICQWRVPMHQMTASSVEFVVETKAIVSNPSQVQNKPTASDTTKFDIGAPRPVLFFFSCPVGLGVKDSRIPLDANVSCTCHIEENNQKTMLGQARWFTSDGHIIGTENNVDHSSTFYFQYEPSNLNQTYTCGAISILKDYNFVVYTPNFMTSTAARVADCRLINFIASGSLLLALGLQLSSS